MGRLPTHFAGKLITFRLPYEMPGELVVQNGLTGFQFPEATFLHAVDKPFEVHRMTARLYPFDDATPPAAIAPIVVANQKLDIRDILHEFIRLRVRDTSKNENMQKAQSLIGGTLKYNTKAWDWEEPYTFVRSEGFEVAVDNIAPATFTLLDPTSNPALGTPFATVDSGNIRVSIHFQGFLIVIAPPSETR